MREDDKESLLSTVLSSGGSWGASWKIPRMIKDSPTGERGHIEDFHLITHKHTLASPASSASSTATLQPVANHTSFCVSRGQNGGEPGPLSVRLPGGIIQRTPRVVRDIARGVKGKRVERIAQ